MNEFEVNEVAIRSEEQSSPGDSGVIASELLSAVTSLMLDAAVVADTDGRVVSVNGHAEELFGGYLMCTPEMARAMIRR